MKRSTSSAHTSSSSDSKTQPNRAPVIVRAVSFPPDNMMTRVADGIRQTRTWRNRASRLVQSFCNALIFSAEETDRKTMSVPVSDLLTHERKNREDQLKQLDLPELLSKATRFLLERAGRLSEEGNNPIPSNLMMVAKADRDMIGNVTRIRVIINGYTSISPSVLDETIRTTEDQLNDMFSVNYEVNQVEETITFSIVKGV